MNHLFNLANIHAGFVLKHEAFQQAVAEAIDEPDSPFPWNRLYWRSEFEIVQAYVNECLIEALIAIAYVKAWDVEIGCARPGTLAVLKAYRKLAETPTQALAEGEAEMVVFIKTMSLPLQAGHAYRLFQLNGEIDLHAMSVYQPFQIRQFEMVTFRD